MSAYEDSIIDMEVILTEEQLDAIMDDLMAEAWVDLMEVEEPTEFDYNSYPDAPSCITNGILTMAYRKEEPQLDSESGFDQEFLRDCN